MRPAANRRLEPRRSSRARPLRYQGPGSLPQPTDRADPVCSRDGRGLLRTGVGRAGLDHEDYILDLSPASSLVRYLVGRHTVFMISWQNPTAQDRDLGMDDYLRLGVLDALKAVQTIVPGRDVNAVGYCLGGTLLSIAAAFLAGKGEAHQFGDAPGRADPFTQAGELMLFIDDSQVNYLEDIMWIGLSRHQADGRRVPAVAIDDLVWSRLVHEYLMGQRALKIDSDLMAWNADTTRMPSACIASICAASSSTRPVRRAVPGGGRPVVLSDIRAPKVAVTTEATTSRRGARSTRSISRRH